MGWYESRKGYSTVKDVSVMYGINETTIIDWITKGYLKAEVYENEKPKYWISDEQLQNFDREYNEALRLIKRGDRKNNATVVGPKMVEIFNRISATKDDFVPDSETYDGFAKEETPVENTICTTPGDDLKYIFVVMGWNSEDTGVVLGAAKSLANAKLIVDTNSGTMNYSDESLLNNVEDGYCLNATPVFSRFSIVKTTLM